MLKAKQTYVITLCNFLENKSAVEETRDSNFEPPLCRALPLVGGSAGRLGTRCLRGAVAHQPPGTHAHRPEGKERADETAGNGTERQSPAVKALVLGSMSFVGLVEYLEPIFF